MKKIISMITTVAMLFGMLSVFMVTNVSAESLDDHLISHWDFEGDNPLADKATAGDSADTMALYGKATAGGGVATIPTWGNSNSNHALYVSDSADSLRTTENRTLFIRFSSDHADFSTDGVDDNTMEIVSQDGAVRLGIDKDNQFFGSTCVAALGENSLNTTGMNTYAQNTYITIAVSYDKSAGNGTFTMTTYFKVGTADWIVGSVERTDTAHTWTQNDTTALTLIDGNSLVFGRNAKDNLSCTWGGVLTFDDIRIYDVALNADEIASIDKEFGIDKYLLTHWDFAGADPLADKAVNGASSDTLLPAGETSRRVVKDGVVSIMDSSNYSYLTANDSADLFRTAESRTLYIKFRTDTVDQIMALMSQNSALRIVHNTNADEFIVTTSPTLLGGNGANGIWPKADGWTFDANTWYTLAISYDKNGSSVAIKGYVLEDGEVVASAAANYTIEPTYWTTDSNSSMEGIDSLYIGRNHANQGSGIKNLEIDDIRIYGKALTETDILSIQVETNPADVEVKGYNLALGGDIGVNFYLSAQAAVAKNATVTITNGETVLLENAAFDAAHATDRIASAYMFSARVAAKEMADKLTLTVKNGETVYYTEEYSVLDYAKVILADTETYAKEIPLVNAMLNLGGSAQSYFDYNTENPANAGLEAPADVTVVDTYKQDINGDLAAIGVAGIGATLNMVSKTEIVYTITLADEMNAADYTITGGTAIVAGNVITVVTDGILAQNLEDMTTLTVTKGEATVTVAYAPLTYVMNMLGKTECPEATQNLCKALFAYNAAANDYVAPAAE